MITIGNEYEFNNVELSAIKKRYNLINIPYNKSSQEVIKIVNKFLSQNRSKIIVLNVKNIEQELMEYLIELTKRGYKLIEIEDFLENYLNKLYISSNHITCIKSYNKWQYFQKRIVDLIIGLPLAIVTAPIMLFSVYKIKKESPCAPPIFKQIRVGKDGKTFVCYKFRSMHVNCEYVNKYAQTNDPRIFKYGRFMRKTRIDELPQLLNVLKGEMHLIGPRAEWIDLVENYEKELPNYHFRHKVAPGITGWAQVNYPYGQNIEDTRQKLMYDLYYIKHWNLWLEIKTVFKTVSVILSRKGL